MPADNSHLLQEQIDNAKTTARTSLVLSRLAVFFSFCILGFNAFNTFYKEHPLKSQLKISIDKQEKILGLQDSYANNLYNIDTALLNQIKSLKVDLENDKLDRESMLRKLRRIEAKVNKFEKEE